jgi:two-component system response regulator YesN
MFRAFVVDDEPSVLEGMKIMIPWSELDFELCGVSSNGQEALLELERLRPHLIITDIRMPLKSGLEFINEVRKLNMDTEFVILSGFSDFAYAREAMRHQVSYYLLKPLDREEIISVLHKIKDKLDTKFLTGYGFSQADMETFKVRRSLPAQDIGNGAANEENGGVGWKSVRDSFDEELTTALKLMNFQEAKKLIDELFDFFEAKGVSLTNARIVINSCVYNILRVAFEKNIRLSTILPPEKSRKWDFPELKSYITDILSQLIGLMLEDRRRNSRSYLYEVKAYIEKNFEKELSVSFLAEMVFFEAGYLGDAFSKQFGCTINEYQHRLRIEKAIELIKTTDMKLSEISDKVGYNNYNNFFSHFVKITHIKPAEYVRK